MIQIESLDYLLRKWVDMEKIGSGIYWGRVIHQRIKPKHHKLVYKVFSFLVDLDELANLSTKFILFSYNAPSLFSIYDRDHGDGRSLRVWVESILEDSNLSKSADRILMLGYPRIFGYVFNPLTAFFCYNPDGRLGAIVYEVHNTHKERHWYVLPVDKDNVKLIKQTCSKEFYVSPFLPMDCIYAFKVLPPNKTVKITINERDTDGPVLSAAFTGMRSPFNSFGLIKAALLYPFMTLKVIVGIHFEALILFLKRVPYFPHKAKDC